MKEFSDFQVTYLEEKGSYKEEEDHRRNPVPKKVVEWERTFDRTNRYKKKQTNHKTKILHRNKHWY